MFIHKKNVLLQKLSLDVLTKHKIKKNNKSDMHNFTDKHRYSEKFIDWFLGNISQPNWIKAATDHYRSQLAKSRKQNSKQK